MEAATVQATEQTPEAVAEQLASAAASAPTTTEEAIAQVSQQETPQVASRPENVPEKFWNAEKGELNTEALLQSYTELEKAKTAPVTEEKPEEAQEETPKGDDGVTAPAAVIETLSKAYEADGQFTDEHYAMAEKAGFTREVVDQYVAGQVALAEAATRQINEAAGGEENKDRLLAWASTALTPEQIDAYNKSFGAGDVNAAVTAMAQLKAEYETANGRDPARALNGKPSGSDSDTFASWGDVTLAMSDPKYGKDTAYTQKVQAKLARSGI